MTAAGSSKFTHTVSVPYAHINMSNRNSGFEVVCRRLETEVWGLVRLQRERERERERDTETETEREHTDIHNFTNHCALQHFQHMHLPCVMGTLS